MFIACGVKNEEKKQQLDLNGNQRFASDEEEIKHKTLCKTQGLQTWKSMTHTNKHALNILVDTHTCTHKLLQTRQNYLAQKSFP